VVVKLIAVAALLLGGPQVLPAEDQPSRELLSDRGLVDEYAAHVAQLEKALDNVRCRCRCEERAESSPPGAARSEQTISTYTADLFMKSGALEAVIRSQDADAGAPDDRELVVCLSQDECFQLERNRGDTGLHVAQFSARAKKDTSIETRMRMRVNGYVKAHLGAACNAYEIPVKKLLERAPISVEEVEKGGHTCIRATCAFPSGALYKTCRLILDPDLEYAVKEYEYEFNSEPGVQEWRRGVVDCRRLDDGLVVPVRVHIESGSESADGRRERRIDAQLDDFKFGDVTDTQFSLTAFNLPAVPSTVGRGHYPFDRWYFWCIIVAALAGMISLRRKRGA
jgi:hypothetical protein